MNYRISWRADKDLVQICNYIAQDNVNAADRLDAKIHEAIMLLAQFPLMGHTRADVRDTRYRFWAVGNYVIGYRIEKDALVVMRVVHGARDFRLLFK
jgi:toxin ParE1/3/4